MKTQIKVDITLVLVTMFWGVSYLLIDYSLEELDPFNINAMRFIIAFMIPFLFWWKKLIKVSLSTLKYSACLGFILFLVYVGATFGVKYTSLSNAGFLCSLAVVITPILAFFIKKTVAEKKLIAAVILALLGIAFLTLDESLKPAIGDLYCILCAVAYSFHLLLTETAVKKEGVNAFQLGVYQLGFSGIYQLIFSIITESPRLPATPKVWVSIMVLTVFCTGISFVVQTIAQQYTTASRVGVIFSLEPVFAALVAFFVAGEILTGRGYLGAALLLAGIFVMEIDLRDFIKIVKKKLAPSKKKDLRQHEDN